MSIIFFKAVIKCSLSFMLRFQYVIHFVYL